MEDLTGWKIERSVKNLRTIEKSTLIIPTYRRPKSLISLLEQLIILEEVPSEVIIVDGTPGKEVEEPFLSWVVEKELPFEMKYIRSSSGLTIQRNIGIEASCGEIIFFLDDDCVPQEGYFRSISMVFQEDTKHKVGGVAGSIINEMDHPPSFRWHLRMWLNIVPRNGIPGKYYNNATSVPRGLMPLFTGKIQTDILPGGASAFRKEVFNDNHFSEFFKGYAQGEDLEMSLRVSKNWQLIWCGDAHILHLHTQTGRPHPFEKGKMEIYNRFFIWKRYTPNPSWPDQIRFWSDVILIAILDLARYIIKPWRNQPLLHSLGVISGVFSCIFNPPVYDEPPVKREYSFEYETIPIANRTKS